MMDLSEINYLHLHEECELINDTECKLKCRCCLSNEIDMDNIFETLLGSVLISEMLSNLTSINYTLDDGLSQYICSYCVQKLSEIQEFSNQCIVNQKILKSKEIDDNESEVDHDQCDTFEEIIVEEVVCSKCEKIFNSSEELINHISNFHDNQEVTSTPCIKKPKMKSARKHSCQICDKKFETPAKVKRHMNVHRDILSPKDLPEKPKKYYNHSCDICHKKVETPSKLERHKRTHDKSSRIYNGINIQRPFGCNKCDLRFWDEVKLEKHQIIHSEDLKNSKINHPIDHNFICVICTEKIRDYDDLMEHMKSHKDEFDEKSKIVCKLCLNSYPCLTNIIRHSKCHLENATHKCIYCGKMMGIGEDFLNHLLRHQNFKPFTCEICGKSFMTLKRLEQHQILHSKRISKDFICDCCDISFMDLESLTNHQEN